MKAKYGVPLIFLLMLFFEPFRLVAYGDTDKLSFPFNPSHLSAQSNSFPCVIVNQAHIEGVEQFNRIKPKLVREWKQLIEGQCVSDSILIGYAERVNSDLAQEGYITSYLFYPEQNFLFGILKARLLARELSNIRYEDGSSDHISLSNAFPQIAGQAFNLRQVEQGLFNLQNTSLIPYQISLIRDDDGGENNTQLVVERKVKRAVKGLLSLESQASSGQPTHIISHTLLSANPFLLNDLLYVDMKSDLGIEPNKKLKSAAFFTHYLISIGYFLPTRAIKRAKRLNPSMILIY
ncbi:MAG: POTRA domain-containing protein [Providencia heimbachae]|nr:POTRA domain-containing protein [Providencia heimbachae]